MPGRAAWQILSVYPSAVGFTFPRSCLLSPSRPVASSARHPSPSSLPGRSSWHTRPSAPIRRCDRRPKAAHAARRRPISALSPPFFLVLSARPLGGRRPRHVLPPPLPAAPLGALALMALPAAAAQRRRPAAATAVLRQRAFFFKLLPFFLIVDVALSLSLFLSFTSLPLGRSFVAHVPRCVSRAAAHAAATACACPVSGASCAADPMLRKRSLPDLTTSKKKWCR